MKRRIRHRFFDEEGGLPPSPPSSCGLGELVLVVSHRPDLRGSRTGIKQPFPLSGFWVLVRHPNKEGTKWLLAVVV